ncbi:MAG: acetyl-CoA carboxylase biotin carboxylase subunit [Bacteroidales bacterium]|nr:acetyl-CoA carboxylase biotin carboxylase subunit [Bacteroidales bacterium]
MKVFKKILIANRSEIAVRVIRSAQELGIETVAVYSSADEEGLHVELADEAWSLGESIELSETYLNIEKIIDIAQLTGSEAIHPGYGFLAENPAFVAACEKAGIVFIGPNTRAIQLMGNKIESREFIKKIGIPMTAGITGDNETLIKKAKEIPLPILVKAAAGGGGKGMRIVKDLKDLPEILESTSREAKSYFGDETIFIEKYVEEPRHIEIQVIGDNFGNVVHLYERECSIQRRYQKIIEESPSPTLTQEVREKMGTAAVKIAKEIGYNNAGTVEFLVDKDLNFYFLEMNTRIQVEHPVTEMVTGIDIVMEQILIAAGNELSIHQEDVFQDGHAIECRIYAEDPSNSFLPSPGDMSLYLEPEGEDIRIDTGIQYATTIQSFYDPMISKLIVWGDTREKAREKMIDALQSYIIQGIKTNITYLIQLMQQQVYIDNQINTRYCDDHTDEIVEMIEKEKLEIRVHFPIGAFLIYDFHRNLLNTENQDYDVWDMIGYWRDLMEMKIDVDGNDYNIRIPKQSHGEYEFEIDGRRFDSSLQYIEQDICEITIDDQLYTFFISYDKKGKGFVTFNGHTFILKRNDILVAEDVFGSLETGGKHDGEIVSPMPGKVIKINVREGQKVTKGDILLIVEAMKMENNIVSPKDAVIASVNVKPGDMVDGSTELVAMQDPE